LNNNKTVRLYGIDAPEMQQPYGKKSRDFLISLVNNKEIKLTQKGVDKYGRVIGIIHINGQNVNELLIKNGFAWVYKKYYNRSRVNWMILEDKAKRNKLGLWKQDNPLEPWKFRNN
jgi:endonuclease YncB( thermonuclease family)